MLKQGLILAVSTLLIATAASRPGNPLREEGCPSAPAQLNVGDIASVTISEARNLNVRSEPGLAQEIIAGVPKDASVTIVAGPACKDGYRWYRVSYMGQSGWSVEVGPEGLYSLFPTGTSQAQPVQSSESQPSTLQQLGCNIWPYFCQPGTNAVAWEFPKYQCTWYAASRRPDVYNWMPVYGVNARDWASVAVQNQIPVSSGTDSDFAIDNDHVRTGDLVVLQPGCTGADAIYGHVAYVESVDYTNEIIHVSEYNARYSDYYDERDLHIDACMSFIH